MTATWVLWALLINGQSMVKIDDYYETKEDCLRAAEVTAFIYTGRPHGLAFACTPSADYVKSERKLKHGETLKE